MKDDFWVIIEYLIVVISGIIIGIGFCVGIVSLTGLDSGIGVAIFGILGLIIGGCVGGWICEAIKKRK
ncbi:MAG: hypothetical protein LBP63_09730 [Prevotellaceae bacterium]|jgi:hypothetical protein|nr:hypothetical protein [Prevotellaceae bacterium]